LAWAVPVLVALVTFVAFAPALRAGFVTWDDNRNFLDNPAYRGLHWPQLRWMWTSFHMGHYVPLTWMTLGLDYELWGMNAAGYHLQNLLLHATNAVLVYVLARRVLELAAVTTEPLPPATLTGAAATAALLFAVHPLRVESVAWITERRDMLSLAWCLTSVLCYLRRAREDQPRNRWYALAIGAFVCALLSKATSVSLPVVLLVLNVYPLRRIGGVSGVWSATARRVYVELLPFALLAVGASALSIVALQPPGQLSLGAKLAVSAYSLTFYLSKTLVPVGLAPLYEMPKSVDPTAVRYVVSYFVVAALTAVAWAARWRYPGVTTALIAFLIVILPMLGIVQNGPQIAADRYTYHAAPALAILAGGAVARWRGPPAFVRVGVIAIVLALCIILTWRQTRIWHDSESLWARVLDMDPKSSIAQIAMGDLLIAQDRVDEAADHYARGVELDPTFAIGFNNLGVVLARQGKLGEATERYRRAVRLRPSYADAHNNWGIALSQQGDYPGAIAHFEQAIAIDPRNADAEVNLGNALVRQQRQTDAMAHYARAATLRPNDVDAYFNWGVALAQLGNLPDAIAQFRRVLAIRPGHVDARDYLDRAERMRSSAASPRPQQ
jgi:Tfp pilus assembly protein PilF